jgi:hypothetical protein
VSRIEYEVKVAYDGDDLILSHEFCEPLNRGRCSIVATYDSEEWTSSDAAVELISNLHDVQVEITVSADIPGGKLYLLTEITPED